MRDNNKVIHPYIPNSVSSIREQMLLEIGAKTIEELYEDIPERLRTKGRMNLPDPFISEYALKMHVESILKKNSTCLEYLSFLGAGCYQHYVPAICDEVNQRGEFLTAYDGGVYTDHGKHQAFFEYLSMMPFAWLAGSPTEMKLLYPNPLVKNWCLNLEIIANQP